MSAVVTPDQMSAIERILIGGDLAQLTPGERVNHYLKVCEALHIDWRTRPFDYLKDRNGKLQMYARKDCAEQLRKRDGIGLTLPKEEFKSGLYIVTARATTKDGRQDEDKGAVPIENLKGEMLANAILKATTKAKRRVTLSICGIGLPDESELDAIPGAVRVAAELPDGAVPSDGYEAQDVVAEPPKPKPTISTWLDELEGDLMAAEDMSAFEMIDKSPRVMKAKQELRGAALNKLWQMLSEHKQRLLLPPGGENDVLGEEMES